MKKIRYIYIWIIKRSHNRLRSISAHPRNASKKTRWIGFTTIPFSKGTTPPYDAYTAFTRPLHEQEYFVRHPEWRHDWSLQAIPDPCDPNPIRIAFLACLMDEMVTAFNIRLDWGIRRGRCHLKRYNKCQATRLADAALIHEKLPWVNRVPGLETEISFIRNRAAASKVFHKRNIIAHTGHLYSMYLNGPTMTFTAAVKYASQRLINLPNMAENSVVGGLRQNLVQ